MEIVLEHEEVGILLKEALKARGTKAPPGSVMLVRRNNKKNTIRAVFTDKPTQENP